MTTCNVQTTDIDLGLVTLIEGGFSQYDDDLLKVIQFAERQEESVQLVKLDETNRISAFWFTEEERLGDGFSASFTFTYNGDGTADGFGFVVQDIRTFDTVSGGGSALGFSNAFDNYLAVGFDFCFDRNDGDCTLHEIRAETRIVGGEAVKQSETNPNFFGNVTGDLTVGVRIDYLEDLETVQVFVSTDLDNPVTEPQLNASGINLSEILTRSQEFTFFGFTASNSESAALDELVPLDLLINNLDIIQFNSGFRMRPEDLVQKVIEFGQLITLGFLIVDSCNLPDASAPTLEENDIIAFITDRNSGIVLNFQDFNQNGPEIILTFPTLANVVTNYDLQIEVNGVLVQQNPVPNIIAAEVPESGGLSALGIGLLIALIAVLALAILFIARGWYKYKKLLVEHKDDIEYGQTKEEIDIIDKTMEYVMNPMVAPLDKLKERLAENERRLAALKASQQEALDSDYTVEQLKQENIELRTQMAELKKQEEYENAANRQSTTYEKNVFGEIPTKNDFEQDRV